MSAYREISGCYIRELANIQQNSGQGWLIFSRTVGRVG